MANAKTRCSSAVALTALVILGVCSGAAAQACLATSVEVKNTGVKPALPVNTSTAFDKDEVEQHFESIFVDDFRSNINTTFSCVDSRGEYDIFGTPGGDFGELAAAIVVYFRETGIKPNYDDIKKIFAAFVKQFASSDRPFYYHTSDEKLHKVFHHLEEGGMKPKPTVFPEIMPEDPKVKDAWLDALTIGHYQGCGHVRLMIDQFADYGLENAAVPQALVRAFFEYWWPTPAYSDERSSIKMTVVQGPLDGHAVAIVGSKGCSGKSPALPPSHGGSQLFIYNADAADDFRLRVLTPFFVDYAKKQGKTVNSIKYYNSLRTAQAKMLSALLANLPPANALPIWSVTIDSEEAKDPKAKAPNTRPRPLNLANPRGRRSSNEGK